MAADAVREQMAYRQGGGQRAQAQQRGQQQPAPVAMVARGRRDHLAREDADEHQRQQRVGRELRSEEHTSELQSQSNLVCRLLLEKKKKKRYDNDDEHYSIPLYTHSV